MIYDLTNPLHRKQFVNRCNNMLRKHAKSVELKDESKRSLNQNAYLHVLIRILAVETGVTEKYAKDVYFKQFANGDIFVKEEKDKISGVSIQYLRSSSDLSVDEMSRAINKFRHWAEDNGFYLPEAEMSDDGTVSFKTVKDAEAFRQGEIESARLEQYL